MMKNLLPLDISSATMVNEYLSAFPPVISELTFTNLFAWRQGRPVWLMELDETLLFLIKTDICRNDQMVIFGPPVGIKTLAEIFRCRETMPQA
jgi:hypothetical protein